MAARRSCPASPRAHRDPAVVAAKMARLNARHVRPLQDLVRAINAERGAGAAPWFDPDGGGTAARVLFLLECPGPRSTAAKGSGFISPDNNDGTAENFFTLREQARLPRDVTVIWNVVPWYLPDGAATRNATRADVAEAAPWLDRLVALLPHLRLVITMGDRARDGWMRYLTSTTRTPLLPTLAVPHPSPQRLNTDPDARGRILTAMQRATEIATST